MLVQLLQNIKKKLCNGLKLYTEGDWNTHAHANNHRERGRERERKSNNPVLGIEALLS